MVDTRQDIGYVDVGLHKFGNDVNVVKDSLAFFYPITWFIFWIKIFILNYDFCIKIEICVDCV